ncbi:MAG: hypothetical protein QF745_09785, partial [Planctomycetota bacterium]|nr:hypothetical protein [Planctomycetota bacterium]
MLSALNGQGCVEGRAPTVGEHQGASPAGGGSALTEAEMSNYKLHSIDEDHGFALPTVSAIFNDDKFNKEAKKYGISPGFAMDIRTGFDFELEDARAEARARLREEKPSLLIGSPICGPWSQMNNINKDSENMRAHRKRAVKHLRFTLEMFTIQVEENHGFVLFEHPWTAKSWDTDIMQEMMRLSGMKIYRCHQCMYQDKKIQANGKFGFIRKDTGWATNCPDIGSLLTKTCDGKHEHVSLENGVTARAAFYCIGLVRAVLRGLAKACRRNEASQVALDFGYTCHPCAPGKSSGGDYG